jgi:hypothetical protein
MWLVNGGGYYFAKYLHFTCGFVLFVILQQTSFIYGFYEISVALLYFFYGEHIRIPLVMYAGEILWKGISIGIRVLPMEMSIEVDIEYSGNPVFL